HLGVEDLRRQLDAPGLRTRRVLHVDGGHHFPPFAALRIRTRPPLGPGTAPSTRSRPFSASTAWTRRFDVVTRSPPMRPAMRRPLTIRPAASPPQIVLGDCSS